MPLVSGNSISKTPTRRPAGPIISDFVPKDGAPLYRFNTPAQVIAHAKRVFGLWKDRTDGVFVQAASLSEIAQVFEPARALQAQVAEVGEVVVTTTSAGRLGIGYRSLRARVAVECMTALIDSQRFAACARCGGWFPVQRAGAKYCSGRCQGASYRERGAR